MKHLIPTLKLFFVLFITHAISITGKAMEKDSSKINGPDPKKASTVYKFVKISVPNQYMIDKADQEIIRNIQTDIRALFSFNFSTNFLEKADKEIDKQFYDTYKLSFALPLEDSDKYINKCFNTDFSLYILKK